MPVLDARTRCGSSPLLGRQHPDELDVAAERDRLDAVLGLAAPARPQRAAEADEVLRDLDPEELRRGPGDRARAARWRSRHRRRTAARPACRAARSSCGPPVLGGPGAVGAPWPASAEPGGLLAGPGVGRSTSSTVRWRRPAPRRVRRARSARLHRGDDPGNRSSPARNALDAHLVGGVVDRRSRAARPRRPRGPGGPRGTPRRRAGRTPSAAAGSSRPRARRRGPGRASPAPARSGSASSGGEACASVEPSLNSTIEWTTDGGVDDDLDALEGDAEEQVRLDHLEPLVDQGRGVDRDDRSHRPGRVGERLLGGDVGSSLGVPAAERAAAGGEHQPADLVGAAAAQALGQRAVLGVDRDDLAGRGRPVTSGPPMISDSLFASASVVPASSAASVGRSPTAPVMPLSTTSHWRAAASTDGLLAELGEVRRELRDLGARTGRGWEPPAVSPTTRNRSGFARTRSRAWVPMEPVEPSRTTSRRGARAVGRGETVTAASSLPVTP